MSVQPEKLVTATEYLEMERSAELKSEYFRGEIFTMAGASVAHNIIASNILRELGVQLKGRRDCLVFPSDMRVRIAKLDKYTYPDITVVCGKRTFDDQQSDTLLNPSVLFEVLSESTEAYDRGKKFEHYQRLDSLAEYILVAQDSRRLEQYVRQPDGAWRYSSFQAKNDVVGLGTIDCELSLSDVYLKVEFEARRE